MSSILRGLSLALAVAVLSAHAVFAATVTAPIEIEVIGFIPGTDLNNPPPGTVQAFSQTTTADANGDFAFDFSAPSGGPLWTLNNVEVGGNVDPVADLNFAVTNNTAADLDFLLTVTVPIAPPLFPSTLSAGTAGVTVSNTAFFGGPDATIKNNLAGDPLFAGLIDGVEQLTLLDTISLTAPALGSNSDSEQTATFPAPSVPTIAAATSIGIELNFTVTAFDLASGTTSFVVEAIPEPSSLALVTVLGLAAATRRR